MRVLKMDLLGAPAAGDLVEHHLGDLHFSAANPGDVAAIKFNLWGEDSSHWFSPGTSIREGRTSRRSGSRAKWKSRCPPATEGSRDLVIEKYGGTAGYEEPD